jgi:hypothetical protein
MLQMFHGHLKIYNLCFRVWMLIYYSYHICYIFRSSQSLFAFCALNLARIISITFVYSFTPIVFVTNNRINQCYLEHTFS